MRPQTSKIHVCLGLLQLRADMESAPTTVSDRTDKPKFADAVSFPTASKIYTSPLDYPFIIWYNK